MRRIAMIAVLLAACSGGGSAKDTTIGNRGGSGTTASTTFAKDTYHCTPPADVDPDQAVADCKAKGCDYQQALVCRGIEPPPEVEEAERKSREDGTIACQCVCESDRTACSMVP